jgi:hypothetical protein
VGDIRSETPGVITSAGETLTHDLLDDQIVAEEKLKEGDEV